MHSLVRQPFIPVCRRHLPRTRVVLHEQGGWQVLIAPRNRPEHTHQAASGALFLQLWNPDEQLSILVPSAETDFAYELLPSNGHPVRMDSYHQLVRFIHEQLALRALPPSLITDLYTRYILAALVGATVPR